MKNTIIAIVIIVFVGLGIYYFTKPSDKIVVDNNQNATTTNNTASTTNTVDKTKTIIGKSVEGRDIVAYHFGEGGNEILFVGGVHGGYDWNTSLLAYEAIDYLKANPSIIPSGKIKEKVTIIPVLNPDGLYKVVGTSTRFAPSDVSKSQNIVVSGRFNANGVDINRNFDCDWQSTGKWQNKTVSGGSAVFSEPESLAIKNYIEKNKPKAVIVWYSAAGGVYSSNCHTGISTLSNTLTNVYASASGYRAYANYDYYETTGDLTNWLAKINIPAISVLLTTHDNTEWSRNKAGIEAIIALMAK